MESREIKFTMMDILNAMAIKYYYSAFTSSILNPVSYPNQKRESISEMKATCITHTSATKPLR